MYLSCIFLVVFNRLLLSSALHCWLVYLEMANRLRKMGQPYTWTFHRNRDNCVQEYRVYVVETNTMVYILSHSHGLGHCSECSHFSLSPHNFTPHQFEHVNFKKIYHCIDCLTICVTYHFTDQLLQVFCALCLILHSKPQSITGPSRCHGLQNIFVLCFEEKICQFRSDKIWYAGNQTPPASPPSLLPPGFFVWVCGFRPRGIPTHNQSHRQGSQRNSWFYEGVVYFIWQQMFIALKTYWLGSAVERTLRFHAWLVSAQGRPAPQPMHNLLCNFLPHP